MSASYYDGDLEIEPAPEPARPVPEPATRTEVGRALRQLFGMCTCRPDEDVMRTTFEPCESGCQAEIGWVEKATFASFGWAHADQIDPGFFERSSCTYDGVRHNQTWTRHTPERCRELRGIPTRTEPAS